MANPSYKPPVERVENWKTHPVGEKKNREALGLAPEDLMVPVKMERKKEMKPPTNCCGENLWVFAVVWFPANLNHQPVTKRCDTTNNVVPSGKRFNAA